MASLDKTSSISIVAVIFIIFAVTIEGSNVTTYNDMSTLKAKYLIINEQWFAGVGIMATAFVCHHNSFIVFNSLSDNSPKTMEYYDTKTMEYYDTFFIGIKSCNIFIKITL
eukprot:154149_1